MNVLLTIIKPLPVLLSVLALHALFFSQVIQHAPEKHKAQPPKPLMVSLIIPKPAPPPIKATPLPVQRVAKNLPKKRVKLKKRKKVKIAKSKKRKRLKKVNQKKVKRKKRKSSSRKLTKKSAKKIAKKSYSKSSKRRKVARLPKTSSSRKKVRTNRAPSRVVKQPTKKTATSSKAPRHRQNRKQSAPKKVAPKKRRAGKTTKPSYRA
ncbi:MAG: hypothetical protein DRQ41_07770, partial [Gammaproteobacteria bacterium]